MSLQPLHYLNWVGSAAHWRTAQMRFSALFLLRRSASPGKSFSRLIQFGDMAARDTRRRAWVRELLPAGMSELEIRGMVEPFVRARLLAIGAKEGTDSHIWMELPHEALIRHWARLQGWITTHRDDIRFGRQVQSAAENWDRTGRPRGSLWRRPDLDLLERYAARNRGTITTLQRQFLAVSKTQSSFEWWLARSGIAAILILAIAAVGFAVSYNAKRLQAQESTIAAQENAEKARENEKIAQKNAANAEQSAMLAQSRARFLPEYLSNVSLREALLGKESSARALAVMAIDALSAGGLSQESLSRTNEAAIKSSFLRHSLYTVVRGSGGVLNQDDSILGVFNPDDDKIDQYSVRSGALIRQDTIKIIRAGQISKRGFIQFSALQNVVTVPSLLPAELNDKSTAVLVESSDGSDHKLRIVPFTYNGFDVSLSGGTESHKRRDRPTFQQEFNSRPRSMCLVGRTGTDDAPVKIGSTQRGNSHSVVAANLDDSGLQGFCWLTRMDPLKFGIQRVRLNYNWRCVRP